MLPFDQYLSIDFGSTTIKGVLFKKVLGKTVILRKEVLPVVDLAEGEGDPLEYNIIRFIHSFFPEETRFLLNLGVQNVYVREIQIPLVSEKAILEVLPFEMENRLPFPIEELEVIGKVWDSNADSSDLITFNVHHKELINALSPFTKGDLNVLCLSVDSFVLASLVEKSYPNILADENIMQLDIGGRFSILNILKAGKLRHTRQIPIAGEDFTKEIANLLKLNVEDARAIKESLPVGFLLGKMDEKEVSFFCQRYHILQSQWKSLQKLFLSVWDDLIHEMENSIFSLPEKDRPSFLLLSGGGTSFRYLTAFLEEKLGIKVGRYEFLGIEDPISVVAVASSVHYESRNRVNFLESKFAKGIHTNRFRFSNFIPHFILFGVSLFLLLGVFVIGILLDKRKINANKKVLIEKYKSGIGGEVSLDDDVLDLAAKKLKEEKKKTEIYRLFLSQESVLDLLNEVNEQFPGTEMLPFVLDQFNFEENEIQIYGRVNEFSEIGVIQAALEKSEKFSNIQVQNKRLITGVNKYKVSFKIKMDIVAPKDDI